MRALTLKKLISKPASHKPASRRSHHAVASDEEMEYGFIAIFALLCITFFLATTF